MRNSCTTLPAALVAFLSAAAAMAQLACPGDGGCFVSNGSPGCDDASCCIRICLRDPFCCDSTWDDLCAGQASNHCVPACPSLCGGDLNDDAFVDGADLGGLLNNWGKAGCGDLNVDGTIDGADLNILLEGWGPCPLGCGSPHAGDCCGKRDGKETPFCNNLACCLAVCAWDEYCCQFHWDYNCTVSAGLFEVCGCEQRPVPCIDSENDCFTVGGPGCSDQSCCETICDIDPFCCETVWDSYCVDHAYLLCLTCGHEYAGSCCEPNGTLHCDDLVCCQAVCALDSYCCFVLWDQHCADVAATVAACNCP